MTEANKQDAEPLGLASTAGLGLVERLRQGGNDYTLYYGSGELYDEAADALEAVTRERDDFAAKWHDMRAKYAALRWPGMTGGVKPT